MRRDFNRGGTLHGWPHMRPRLGESFRGIGAELTKTQQTIGKLDTQIGNLVAFIASSNASEAVALNLNALKAKRLAEQQRIGQLKQSADAPIPLPDTQSITRAVAELPTLLARPPKVGRAALPSAVQGPTAQV